MKKVLLLALFSFYFGIRVPEGELPNVFINMVIGPFETLKDCNKYRTETIPSVTMLDTEAVVSECQSVDGDKI